MSSSDEERRLAGTKSQRRWIWSVGGESGQGEAVEDEAGVFGSERGTGAGEAFGCEVGNSFEITADFDFGIVAAAGRSAGPGKNSALEVGFGGVAQVEDTKKIETRVGVEVESVIERETVWCPWSLSGHLERWCFEQGRDLKQHCLGMTGAVGWMTEGSPLEMEGGKREQ